MWYGEDEVGSNDEEVVCPGVTVGLGGYPTDGSLAPDRSPEGNRWLWLDVGAPKSEATSDELDEWIDCSGGGTALPYECCKLWTPELDKREFWLAEDVLMDGEEDPSCFDMILVFDDNWECRFRAEFNGGDEADSYFISLLRASEDAEDDAGVKGGGALLPEDFLDFEPMLSDDESCDFCATCCLHLARRFLNQT